MGNVKIPISIFCKVIYAKMICGFQMDLEHDKYLTNNYHLQ